MTMLTPERLAAAERYLLLHARLIDRLRFAHLFRGGSAAAVRSALAAYANDDGGFGNALEPDLRGAGSQPQPVEVALHVLDETTGPDDPFDDPIVQTMCGYLARVSRSEVVSLRPAVRPRNPGGTVEADPRRSAGQPQPDRRDRRAASQARRVERLRGPRPASAGTASTG
ncbi:MAG: hypothetical protein ACRDVO_08640 [Jiangellaceae bacterium]